MRLDVVRRSFRVTYVKKADAFASEKEQHQQAGQKAGRYGIGVTAKDEEARENARLAAPSFFIINRTGSSGG